MIFRKTSFNIQAYRHSDIRFIIKFNAFKINGNTSHFMPLSTRAYILHDDMVMDQRHAILHPPHKINHPFSMFSKNTKHFHYVVVHINLFSIGRCSVYTFIASIQCFPLRCDSYWERPKRICKTCIRLC